MNTEIVSEITESYRGRNIKKHGHMMKVYIMVLKTIARRRLRVRHPSCPLNEKVA